MVGSLPITEVRLCETCYDDYTAWIHDSGETCPTCRRTRALERIADVLEHWVGML